MLDGLKSWVQKIKKDISILWLASRDERTPLAAHILSSFVVAYVLSPIDLIPDFIPIIGYLDDILIVALGIHFAVKWLPKELLEEFREKAKKIPELPKSYAGAAIILLTWVVVTILIVTWWMEKHP